MKQQDGVALIATLLIMATITALGVGSLFLANMNLRMAENGHTNAIARYNAEAGLDAAMIQLKKDFDRGTPKQFPASLSLPSAPNSTYQAVSYTPYTNAGLRTQAQVIVLGTGPNNARYQTEVFLEAVPATSNVLLPSVPFSRGLASENIVSMSGSPTLKDAPIHGNRGFDISGSGSYQVCEEGGINCRRLSGTDRAVTGASGMRSYECKASGGGNTGLCNGNRPATLLEEPVDLSSLPYDRLRNGDNNSASKFGVSRAHTRTSTTPTTGCTVTLSTASTLTLATTYPSGAKVCVTGNVSIPNNANYNNVTFVVKGDVTIPETAAFKDSNLLSMGTLNLNGTKTLENTRLFADTKVNFRGTINYSGLTTIASGGDVEYHNGSYINNAASDKVSLAILAVRNFTGQGMRGYKWWLCQCGDLGRWDCYCFRFLPN